MILWFKTVYLLFYQGGSWDDNSVGHGSVAARMRRERNRAIQRTKTSASYVVNSINTHGEFLASQDFGKVML